MQQWPRAGPLLFTRLGQATATSIAPALGPRHAHAVAPLLGGDGAAVATSFGLDHDTGAATRLVDHHIRGAGTDADVDLRQFKLPVPIMGPHIAGVART